MLELEDRIGYYRTHLFIHLSCVAMLNKYSFCAFHYFCLNWFHGYGWSRWVSEGCRAQLWPEILQWQISWKWHQHSWAWLLLRKKEQCFDCQGHADDLRAMLSSHGTSSWPPDKLNGNDLVEEGRGLRAVQGLCGLSSSHESVFHQFQTHCPYKSSETNMLNLFKQLF